MAWLAIGCFLVSNGADINHKNLADTSPIDEIADPTIKDLLQKLATYVAASLYCVHYHQPYGVQCLRKR